MMNNKYTTTIEKEMATKRLLKTFRRFGIAKPDPIEAMMEAGAAHLEQAAAMAASMYGHYPTQLIVSPSVFTGLLGQLGK
jgi:predicted Na+-dependent transporter